MHDILKLLHFEEGKAKRETSKIDINKLREMCVTKHGLVSENIRRLVWPILLNAEVISGKDIS